VYTNPDSHNAQRYRQTDRQTDRRTDGRTGQTDNRMMPKPIIRVAVRSAKKGGSEDNKDVLDEATTQTCSTGVSENRSNEQLY